MSEVKKKYGLINPKILWVSVPTLGLMGCLGGGSDDTASTGYSAEIKTTSYGIPHVTASDAKNLSYGVGYVYARDNMCALAETMTTVRGEHSKYFGDQSIAYVGARPVNSLNSDFFHKFIYEPEKVKALWDRSSKASQEAMTAYAAGVNKYLRDTGVAALPEACRNAAWVRPVTAEDIHLYWTTLATSSTVQAAVQLIAEAGEQTQVVAQTSQATPKTALKIHQNTKKNAVAQRQGQVVLAQAARALAHENPDMLGDGSNAWAFGAETTENGKGMLLANPHWSWQSMLKYYVMHLSIPGELNAMGTIRPGTPYIIMGFNEKVAWTHTISTGSRYVIRELKLGSTKTSYVLDGVTKNMEMKKITVELPGNQTATKYFYTTEMGPVIKDQNAGLVWSQTRAFALTDPAWGNVRQYDAYMAAAKTGTAQDLLKVFGSQVMLTAHNTFATDAQGHAVYGDYSMKVNLSDEQIAQCALPGVGQQLTAQGRLVLDGSRSECGPRTDPQAPQPMILSASKLPYLERKDYVANANNSYWMTNPRQFITGLPSVNGGAAVEISHRARMNFRQIEERLAGQDGLPGNKMSLASIQALLIGTQSNLKLGNRSTTAELMMPVVKTLCAQNTSVTLSDGSTQDIAQACQVLGAWDLRFNPESVGPHIFREFWLATTSFRSKMWQVPFSEADPMNTPHSPNIEDATMRQNLLVALGTAVRKLQQNNIALNTPWSELNYAMVRGKKLATGGGFHDDGVPNQITGPNLSKNGYGSVTGGTSYVATVTFDANGPVVEGVLLPGQSTHTDSPYYMDQLEQLWTQRKWYRLPFTPEQIAADPKLSTQTIRE